MPGQALPEPMHTALRQHPPPEHELPGQHGWPPAPHVEQVPRPPKPVPVQAVPLSVQPRFAQQGRLAEPHPRQIPSLHTVPAPTQSFPGQQRSPGSPQPGSTSPAEPSGAAAASTMETGPSEPGIAASTVVPGASTAEASVPVVSREASGCAPPPPPPPPRPPAAEPSMAPLPPAPPEPPIAPPEPPAPLASPTEPSTTLASTGFVAPLPPQPTTEMKTMHIRDARTRLV